MDRDFSKYYKDEREIRYKRRHTVSHLIDTKNPTYINKIHELFLEETEDKRNLWFDIKDSKGELRDFLKDVSDIWQQTDKDINLHPELIAKQCFYALITTSVKNQTGKLPVNLVVALVKKKVWIPERGVAYALQIFDQKEKANLLIDLTEHIPPDSEEWKEAVKESLNTVKNIEDEFYRANVLNDLIEKLPLNTL